jgi:hypothetical protein
LCRKNIGNNSFLRLLEETLVISVGENGDICDLSITDSYTYLCFTTISCTCSDINTIFKISFFFVFIRCVVALFFVGIQRSQIDFVIAGFLTAGTPPGSFF